MMLSDSAAGRRASIGRGTPRGLARSRVRVASSKLHAPARLGVAALRFNAGTGPAPSIDKCHGKIYIEGT